MAHDSPRLNVLNQVRKGHPERYISNLVTGIVDQHINFRMFFNHRLCKCLDIGHALDNFQLAHHPAAGKAFFHFIQFFWIAPV